jgi:hypothetical protein
MQQPKLETGFLLDRQWFWLRGEMEQSKRPTLLALAQGLAEAGTPYASIGGIDFFLLSHSWRIDKAEVVLVLSQITLDCNHKKG